MTTKGHFITFEGGEGCGKSTQLALLKRSIVKANLPVMATREPGGTQTAEQLRELLVTGDTDRWIPEAELLLFYASRIQLVKRLIQPALEDNSIVLCDRFHDSTYVYQGVGKGIALHHIDRLHEFSLGSFLPDITILLDISPKEGLARTHLRTNDEDRFEAMDSRFHEMIRGGFLDRAQAEPKRFVVIDASQPIKAVHQEILTTIGQRLQMELADAS